MSDAVNSLTEDGLPDSFWSVPEKFISDEAYRFLHAEMCARLRNENPQADTLELMAIERIASLYFYMRYSESSRPISNNAAYKNMLQLWITMAADLRKSRVASMAEEEIRGEVMADVTNAVKGALRDLDPDIAVMVKRRIAERLEQV